MHTSHYTHNYVVRGRGSNQAFHGRMVFLGERDSIETVFLGLPGEFFLVEWTVRGKQNVCEIVSLLSRLQYSRAV